MNYAQQATQPAFYESDSANIYFSATAGSSPFNEWYEFESEEEAVTFIESNFTSQSFVDHMSVVDGRLYYNEALVFSDDGIEILDSEDSNDFQAAVDYESRF